MRNAPLVSTGRGISAFDLPDGEREIFFAGGLDHPNQFEPPHENRVLAHAVSGGREGRIGRVGKAVTSAVAQRAKAKACPPCIHLLGTDGGHGASAPLPTLRRSSPRIAHHALAG